MKLIRRWTSLLVALGAIAWMMTPNQVQANEIEWRTDYAEALEEAKENDLPLLVKVGARWCGYCVRMQSETLANEGVVDEVSENFVALELDADRDSELISKFRVSSYPTTIIVAPDRRIVSRLVGFKNSSEYSASLRGALNRLR